VALWHGSQELLNGEILTADEVARRIEAVTAEDIASVAREFLSNEGLSLAVVGPVTADLSADLFSV
jgi:predicted Zn-dependent peptidase